MHLPPILALGWNQGNGLFLRASEDFSVQPGLRSTLSLAPKPNSCFSYGLQKEKAYVRI